MKGFAIFAVVFTMTGCVAPIKYHPPETPTNDSFRHTSIVVYKSKNAVWDRLLKSIADSFFVINNIEKDSGFINMSYTAKAADYIDCGYYIGMQDQKLHLTGESKIIYSGKYRIDKISTKLEGRINVLVQEVDTNKTSISIKIRYIVTHYRSAFDTIAGGSPLDTIVLSFDSGQSGQSEGIECRSFGTMENTILKVLEKVKQ